MIVTTICIFFSFLCFSAPSINIVLVFSIFCHISRLESFYFVTKYLIRCTSLHSKYLKIFVYLFTVRHYHVILLLKAPQRLSSKAGRKPSPSPWLTRPRVTSAAGFSRLISCPTSHSAPATLGSSLSLKPPQTISCCPLQYKTQDLSLNTIPPDQCPQPPNLKWPATMCLYPISQFYFSGLPFFIDPLLISVSLCHNVAVSPSNSGSSLPFYCHSFSVAIQ